MVTTRQASKTNNGRRKTATRLRSGCRTTSGTRCRERGPSPRARGAASGLRFAPDGPLGVYATSITAVDVGPGELTMAEYESPPVPRPVHPCTRGGACRHRAALGRTAGSSISCGALNATEPLQAPASLPIRRRMRHPRGQAQGEGPGSSARSFRGCPDHGRSARWWRCPAAACRDGTATGRPSTCRQRPSWPPPPVGHRKAHGGASRLMRRKNQGHGMGKTPGHRKCDLGFD